MPALSSKKLLNKKRNVVALSESRVPKNLSSCSNNNSQEKSGHAKKAKHPFMDCLVKLTAASKDHGGACGVLSKNSETILICCRKDIASSFLVFDPVSQEGKVIGNVIHKVFTLPGSFNCFFFYHRWNATLFRPTLSVCIRCCGRR